MGPLPRPIRGLTAALVFAATATATVVWCASMADGMPMPGGWTMSMAWMRMPGQSWPGAAAMFVAMWAVMMIAMMLPALVPVMVRHRRPWRVACAYYAVWIAVGIAIYSVGVALAAAEMRWRAVAELVPVAVGVVLIGAGALQLTRWKARELARCRDRSCCAVGRRPGPRQAWLDGARLGGHCVRCCAPLVLALLVVGVMDLAAMAVVMIAISAERLLPRPRVVARAVGVIAIAIGAIAVACVV